VAWRGVAALAGGKARDFIPPVDESRITLDNWPTTVCDTVPPYRYVGIMTFDEVFVIRPGSG
jgi:hypothetical protein